MARLDIWGEFLIGALHFLFGAVEKKGPGLTRSGYSGIRDQCFLAPRKRLTRHSLVHLGKVA